VSTPTAVLDQRGVRRQRITRQTSNAYRIALGSEYVYHPKGVSIAQLADNPELGSIPMHTVTQWARQDRWVERRKRFGELVRRRVERSIAAEIVKRRLETLERLEKMHTELVTKIESEMLSVPLRSLEGATIALLRLGDAIDKIRGDVKDVLVGRQPEAEVSQEGGEPKPTLQEPARFSAQQIRAMAKAARRAKWQELESGEPKAEVEAQNRAAEIARPKKKPPPSPVGDGPAPKSET
jgi:hypothetical protein